jgi:hypothetical protein
LAAARFYDDSADLNQIDWAILQARDFKRDDNDPGKVERYQAECLAREHVPVRALLGVACNSESTREVIREAAARANSDIKCHVTPTWYF